MCDSDEVEIIPGSPTDAKALRKSLMERVAAMSGGGATRYAGANGVAGRLSAGTNPLQARGASILSNLGGMGDYRPATGHEWAHPAWGSGVPLNTQAQYDSLSSGGGGSLGDAPSDFVKLGMSQYPGAIKKRRVTPK